MHAHLSIKCVKHTLPPRKEAHDFAHLAEGVPSEEGLGSGEFVILICLSGKVNVFSAGQRDVRDGSADSEQLPLSSIQR